MGKNLNRLCSICVRGGSKGVPNKNIRQLLGVPLLVHSIEQAKSSGFFQKVVVSSDSNEILDIATNYGADLTVKRPKKLASDISPKLPAIQHCLSAVEKKTNKQYDIIVDLDATSPLRSIDDLKGVIDLLQTNKKNTNVITGSLSRRSPYFNLVEIDESGYVFLSGIRKKWRQMIVNKNDRIEKALKILSKKNQIVFVLNDNERLVGTITDRDIKRGLLRKFGLHNFVEKIMNKNPTVILEDTDEEEIYKIFKDKNFIHLPVVDKNYRLINVRSLETISRRQDTPTSYDLNASIYAWWRNNLINSKNVISEKTKLYIMPEERSVDIDTELDFKWVEFLMAFK